MTFTSPLASQTLVNHQWMDYYELELCSQTLFKPTEPYFDAARNETATLQLQQQTTCSESRLL